MSGELTLFHFSLFSSLFYFAASKPTTQTTTAAALHVPAPMAPTHPKNESTMDASSVEAENSGGDGSCEMIKMATKEEKVLGIVLSKDDDDSRRLKISTTENDATTKVANEATAEGYEHLGEGAVLRTTLTVVYFLFVSS